MERCGICSSDIGSSKIAASCRSHYYSRQLNTYQVKIAAAKKFSCKNCGAAKQKLGHKRNFYGTWKQNLSSQFMLKVHLYWLCDFKTLVVPSSWKDFLWSRKTQSRSCFFHKRYSIFWDRTVVKTKGSETLAVHIKENGKSLKEKAPAESFYTEDEVFFSS